MSDFDHRSPNIDSANQEHYWYSIDTEKKYKTNLKKNYSLLERNGWIDNRFTYKFNSEGFRSEEFQDEPGLLCLGCSFTQGIGLPYEYTWPYFLSKKLNLACWNLGIPGGSNDTAFRLGSHYIPKLKTKIVALLSPPMDRLELISNCGVNYFLPNFVSPRFQEFYNNWLSDNTNSFLNRRKNVLGLAQICDQLQIPFVFFNFEEMPIVQDTCDIARDLLHFGVKTQRNISEKMFGLIAAKS